MQIKHGSLCFLLVAGVVLLGGVGAPVATQAASLSVDGLQAKTLIEKITSTQELEDLEKIIKDRVKLLKKNSSSTRENLTISAVKVSLPDGTDCGSAGLACHEQVITITVKNNEPGAASLTGKTVEYAIYLYDVTSGKKKLFEAASGVVLVPYANGYSEFSASIDGGLPFDGKTFEREYRALIKIDTGKDVKESNEKDNEAWTDSWPITYYKG